MAANDVLLAIKEWQEGKISGQLLQRCLVSYDNWLIPVSEKAAAELINNASNSPRVLFSQGDDGKNRFFIFSDEHEYHSFNQKVGQIGSQHCLKTNGTWVFGLLLDRIDEIVIDPYTDHSISYKNEQFLTLNELSKAITLENTLYRLRFGPELPEGSIALVGEYDSYFLAFQQEGNRICLAPDEQNRKLLAVFTSIDAFDSYAEGQKLLSLKLDGQDLFTKALEMDIDGLVFNCSGPTTVAFAKGFCQIIIDELTQTR